MGQFSWNNEKNESLRQERGVSFEEVIFHIERGDLLDILEHPNQERYPGQRIFIVNIDGYAYLVPFVESKTEVFLKTVEFGPRKADHDGEFIGLVKLSARGTKWAREYLQTNGKADRLRKLQMIDMLNDFVSAGRPVKIHYVRGGWIDVDSLLDLNLALRF